MSTVKVASAKRIGSSELVVVIEGGFADVLSTPAKELALLTATKSGIAKPGINKSSGPYPVGPNGEVGESMEDWGKITKMDGYKYRNDFTVQSAAV